MMFDIAMCDPNHFSIQYSINPWMTPHVMHPDKKVTDTDYRAKEQWTRLYNMLSEKMRVEVCISQPNVPDMVFFGNAGLLVNNTFIPPRFTYPERQAEEPHLLAWARQCGLEVVELTNVCRFEGEADALIDISRHIVWCGAEQRTSLTAHKELGAILDIPVMSLTMVNEYFYHLDTCLSPLSNGQVLYYPQAFDKKSREIIESHVQKELRVPVSDEDAFYFACNAVQFENAIIVNNASAYLCDQLKEQSIEVFRVPLDEFLKSGGGAKCLTLTRYVL